MKIDIEGTVWKLHYFSITWILREINFRDSRSAKSAILTRLEARNFDFLGFSYFVKDQMYLINPFQNP